MSDKKILVATKNKGKLREIKEILSDYQVMGMDEAGFTHETIEDGTTFEENAYKKAFELMELSGLPVLADDSGLMVDALGGKPGVYSSRFAGEHATDDQNIQKLLSKLEQIKDNDNTARFVCCMCLLYPDGNKIIARGECEGLIINENRGESGFGYDPVFYVPSYDKTFAELGSEIKNQISHRRKALENLQKLI